MISIHRTSTRSLKQYSDHLKQLPDHDRVSRFGYNAAEHAIDRFMLSIAYNPDNHELWTAMIDKKIVGWGHMARDHNDVWELAVSVNSEHQRKGIGNMLISEMLEWAKVHHIDEVFMHCIEENRVIQHLALKHGLKTRERSAGERTAVIEVPEPSLIDLQSQMWKEYKEIMIEQNNLQRRMTDLWFMLTK